MINNIFVKILVYLCVFILFRIIFNKTKDPQAPTWLRIVSRVLYLGVSIVALISLGAYVFWVKEVTLIQRFFAGILALFILWSTVYTIKQYRS